jgi:DNA-binding transcriptional regulator YhcF (GntR family)
MISLSMARPRSSKVAETKQKIIARLRDGFHRPGQRFLSNRAVSRTFGISYQTAHRLMAELHAEGWLARAPGSGSFASGAAHPLTGVQLVFHPRARRQGSFGAQLLTLVSDAISKAGIDCAIDYADAASETPAALLPVYWECQGLAGTVARRRRFAVLLNDRPPPGLEATLVDSFSADDYSGGAAAAQILVARHTGRRRFAVLAGPRGDLRSAQRVQGFTDYAPKCDVVPTGTWFAEEAGPAAKRVARGRFDAVFCCNDRLAEALIVACKELKRPCPALVGFDDAPVAETLDLTTIAIPWEHFANDLVALVRRRLDNDTSGACQRIFAPHPVMRRSHLIC